jgi:hypothetical protein
MEALAQRLLGALDVEVMLHVLSEWMAIPGLTGQEPPPGSA